MWESLIWGNNTLCIWVKGQCIFSSGSEKCVYIHTYMCIYVHIHMIHILYTCMCPWLRTHLCACLYACLHTCMNTDAYEYTYMYKYIYNLAVSPNGIWLFSQSCPPHLVGPSHLPLLTSNKTEDEYFLLEVILKYAHHSWAVAFSIFIPVSFTANGISPTANHDSVPGFLSALCLATNTPWPHYISWLLVHFMLRQLSPFYLQPGLLQTPESSACIQDSSTGTQLTLKT